jgi:hypothetical protein
MMNLLRVILRLFKRPKRGFGMDARTQHMLKVRGRL